MIMKQEWYNFHNDACSERLETDDQGKESNDHDKQQCSKLGMKHEVMKRPKFFRIHFFCRVRVSSIRTKAPSAVPQRT